MLWCNKKVDQRLRTLGQDCLFRSILIIGSAISIGLVGWIIYFNHKELTFLCLSSNCFSSILEVFKFPISVVTAVLALAAFVAVIFRSQQTAIQIQETIDQNAFKNYLDHKKQFIDILKSLEEDNEIVFFNKEQLYAKMFPLNSTIKVSFESNVLDYKRSAIVLCIEKYNLKIKKLNSIIENFSSQGYLGSLHDLAKWINEYILVLQEIHINFDKNSVSPEEPYKKYFQSKVGYNNFPSDIIGSFDRVSIILKTLSKFCISSHFFEVSLIAPVELNDDFNQAVECIKSGGELDYIANIL